VAVDAGVGAKGARRRLWTEQAPEREIVDKDFPSLADVVVDLGKATLDFLVRVTGIGEGVQLHLGFAEL
jgi:hypothetical protein